ncbi:TetR/AcrR family transcriptional regulator [Staphylococcus auricularis]|uniref:TetR/AcrR family transcriptional regulator n=1 Tax=Staphylococcus auricularis TaxID=29379 RepID=UPI00242F18F4|nr:TetR/AcrR family transcriptional regulator [Staphylococcus auricularis]
MEEELMTDMRIVKTKRKARKAMITLLKEKKYDDISVKDICETAGISRGTFYLHYKDKYDLVQQYQKEFVKEGTKKALNLLNEERYSFFYQMVKFWNEEAELLLLLISDNGSVEVQNQLRAMLQTNAEKHVFPHMSFKKYSKTEQRYFTVFFSNAVFGMIQEWVNTGRQETPEELSAILNKLAPTDLLE